ncbi:hypothetical protein F5I97DRAFT_1817668 [Phlebopus sp. FC_14]|nr:hypothetical protein F5I97DRAFT_1817668 [Phlebopus sp. FC_14]
MAPEPKNSLSIRLTEPVVFLRSSDPSGRHPPDASDPPALVRGLLTLNVVKPTRISSIEVELACVAMTSWPEGVGTRRIDVTEEHKIYSATATFFHANELPCTRRTASVGPGLSLVNDDDDGGSRTQSLRRGHSPQRRITTEGSASASPNPTRMVRRLSCDTASFGPTPPYTSSEVIPRPRLHTSPSGNTLADSPAQTLEDLRQALRDNLEGQGYGPEGERLISNGSTHCPQDNTSEESHYHPDSLLSQQPSRDEVGAHTPTHPLYPSSRLTSQSPDDRYRDRDASITRVGQRDVSSPRTGRARSRFSLGAVLDVVKEVTRARSRSKDVREDEERGRGRTKVRPTEHRDKEHTHSLLGLGRVLGLDREKAEHGQKEQGDGWKEFRKGRFIFPQFWLGTYTYPISFLLPPSLPPTLTHPRGTLTYTLHGVAHRPGTFTSKLSCQTPVHVVAAPSISTGEGGGAGDPGPVVVERQWEGRLAYMLGLSGRVFVIGSAGTATFDLTLMPLEKVKIWRIGVYLDERVICIKRSGKFAWDEGVKRVSLLNIQDACLASEDPSLSVEKKKGGKHKQKEEEPVAIPILPTPISPHRSPLLQYLSPNADPSIIAGPGPYTLSATIALPNCNDRAADGKTTRVNFTVKNKKANLRVEHQLRVVIRVEKVGDGEGGGDAEEQDDEGGKKKKKAFDIMVQTPVNVLSCRCASEYQALPPYSDVFHGDHLDQLPCPCDFMSSGSSASSAESGYGARELDRIISTDSGVSSFENGNPSQLNPHPHPHSHEPSRLTSRPPTPLAQYQRLVSGQETEVGEAPPSYESVTGSG